ncbi:lysine decarboxylase [Microbacterium sp. cf046]|uniref:aminotransferase class I/II-fold pyridoxal phosphate-dependent enzyme n=1 Tax=Microbacterium sp. cf046 TaxID=1761803 RepID=UPI0008E61D16|nr:aminotransferase class V-fold PLP-dependent enzyme [Microbacterium sp. cf046]SFR92745.1 lysine decarboxylase [Microbacterium sp. cf046]
MTDPRDPLSLADDAPLLAAWLRFDAGVRDGGITPFTIPGHKHRTDLVGEVIRGDVPFVGGLDSMKQSGGVLGDAERRAAAAWGVDFARLSVGGSTHANQAAVLALGRPGQSVVISRTLHRSLLLGIVFAGLRPVWVRPEIDAATGLPGAVPVAAVRHALAENPDACGVIVGDPSYVGTMSDIAGLAGAAHEAGVPLVVDAAWAAYFGFSPFMPPHALTQGADALVTSAHKTLPAWSQAALLLARTTRTGGLLDADRLERGFDASQSTSAAGAILASTDASRALLQRHGAVLVDRLIALVHSARERLSAVGGLVTLTSRGAQHPDGWLEVDPAKLVVLLAGTGAHGHDVEADLLETGLPLEMADRDVLIPIVTLADDESSVTRLVEALISSIERHRGAPRRMMPSSAWTVESESALDPRTAFFAPHETVPASAAPGRVCAELIAPYPPGVPVLAPGEIVTAAAIDALRSTLADGGRIAYAADPTLRTIQVVSR